jgi:hypothetical protein
MFVSKGVDYGCDDDDYPDYSHLRCDFVPRYENRIGRVAEEDDDDD